MDNLTHSLIGAVLGQAGLKRKTGLGMPTLVIAANIPDIDGVCMPLGTVSLAMRRGITHGPIAMLVLPLLLTGIMVWFDRGQARRGKRPADRPPVDPAWLLVLACIGCLSHPLFDWMNSYGIRLLEPFSHRWFYGDALFIVDPWLLAMLIAGVWLARRWQSVRPARVAIAAVAAYLTLNLAISGLAVQRLPRDLRASIAVANPVPLAFWRREVLWRDGRRYGSYIVDPWGAPRPGQAPRPIGMNDIRIMDRLPRSPEGQALLFWSRLPVAEARGDTVVLGDQRFQGRGAGTFTVELSP
ncbi:MAG: metal-dependent hydrolase [Novosphingobium sp.]